MLSTNPELEIRTGPPSFRDRHAHQGSDSFPIQDGEGIGIEDVFRLIDADEFGGVIPRKAEGSLGEIVGPEGEKFGFFCDAR